MKILHKEYPSSSACGVNERKHRQRHPLPLCHFATHIVVEGGIASVLFTVVEATPLSGAGPHVIELYNSAKTERER